MANPHAYQGRTRFRNNTEPFREDVVLSGSTMSKDPVFQKKITDAIKEALVKAAAIEKQK